MKNNNAMLITGAISFLVFSLTGAVKYYTSPDAVLSQMALLQALICIGFSVLFTGLLKREAK